MNNQIKDKDIQFVIGNLLRYGVWTALSIAALGGVIYLIRHGQETIHYGTFTEKNVTIFHLAEQVILGVSQGKGQSIILLGIFLLFLTPILRIIFSLIAFFIEKDYLYVGITLLVIGIICFSVFYGFAH